MRFYYPGVVARFQKSAAWHKDRYGIEPHFGYFWNMCINGIFPGMGSCSLPPSCRFQKTLLASVFFTSIAYPGVSLLLYESFLLCLPSLLAEFKSKERSWLVIWELGIVVELPPGVIALYPSSLFLHWNVDVRGS